MTLVAGTVTVASDESVDGSDYARALYDADVASLVAGGLLPAPLTAGSTAAPFSAARPASADDVANVKRARLAVLKETARRANAYAGATVAYFKANGSAVVKANSSGDGLQDGTTHPSSDKHLPLE